MKEKLNITDQRILQLIDILKREGKIRYSQAFCDAIGFHKQNIRNVKSGTQHFTPEHIRLACKTYNVNANWVMGIEKKVFCIKPNLKQK